MLLALIVLAAFGAAQAAMAASPCQGVNQTPGENIKNKADLERSIAKQLKLPKVSVNRSFVYGRWSIFYVETHKTDPAYLFYSENPLTNTYVYRLGGELEIIGEQKIRDQVLKNAPGIPPELANCFAWYVTTPGAAKYSHSKQPVTVRKKTLPLPLPVILAEDGKRPKPKDDKYINKSPSDINRSDDKLPQTVMADDPLPLKHGSYYPEDVKCPKPGEYVADSVGGILYDGKDCAFNTHHIEATFTNVRNNGNIYYSTRRYLYNGGKSNGGDEFIDKMTIIIKNRTSFAILNDVKKQ